MKFNCGETSAEGVKRLTKWHRWFAWCPTRVGSNDCRWLEWIERQGEYGSYGGDWFWEYRAS